MSRLHIVYGESGASMLRLTLADLGQEDSVVGFSEVLQYTPLFSEFEEKRISNPAELIIAGDVDVTELCRFKVKS